MEVAQVKLKLTSISKAQTLTDSIECRDQLQQHPGGELGFANNILVYELHIKLELNVDNNSANVY